METPGSGSVFGTEVLCIFSLLLLFDGKNQFDNKEVSYNLLTIVN